MQTKLLYILSEVGRALAFEWIADHIDNSRLKLSFILINPASRTFEEFLIQKKIPVLVLEGHGKKNWPAMGWKVYKYLKQHQPDIVHCHLQQASTIGLLAAKAAGIPLRIHTRHHSSFHHVYFPKGVWWDKLNNKLSTHIVAISGLVKKILIEWEGVSEKKVTLIPHGFLLSEFEKRDEAIISALKAKYNPKCKAPVIGVISRFIELKGIQYIIPAFKKLLQQYPDALLLLFNAHGDYETKLNEQLAELPESSFLKVNFEAEIASVYKMLDIFLHVPIGDHYEAFGQIYIEALAAGVPSIFTLSGIAPDFINDKENALVVPYKDADAIYTAMELILKDNELNGKMIKQGRESVRDKFALTNMINNLETLYAKAVH